MARISHGELGVSGFDLAAVEAGIAGTEFAGLVMHFPSATSTNQLALEAAQAGARSGVWVADEQIAGRGRGGHGWHSVAGDGLYVSALVAPALPMQDALLISLATGLAARGAIEEIAGLPADIRWPNDVLVNGRKCGGILVETAMAQAETNSSAMLRYAVIGVGINLNHETFPAEIDKIATSLRRESGAAISREAILVALLERLDGEIKRMTGASRGISDRRNLLNRFAEASSWVKGKRVRVGESGGGYTGVTAGLDDRGFLLVDGEDGVRRTVLSGGVREL